VQEGIPGLTPMIPNGGPHRARASRFNSLRPRYEAHQPTFFNPIFRPWNGPKLDIRTSNRLGVR